MCRFNPYSGQGRGAKPGTPRAAPTVAGSAARVTRPVAGKYRGARAGFESLAAAAIPECKSDPEPGLGPGPGPTGSCGPDRSPPASRRSRWIEADPGTQIAGCAAAAVVTGDFNRAM